MKSRSLSRLPIVKGFSFRICEFFILSPALLLTASKFWNKRFVYASVVGSPCFLKSYPTLSSCLPTSRSFSFTVVWISFRASPVFSHLSSMYITFRLLHGIYWVSISYIVFQHGRPSRGSICVREEALIGLAVGCPAG